MMLFSGSSTAQRFSVNWILWSSLRRRSYARCPGASRIGPRISEIRSEESVGSFPKFPRHSRVRRGRQEKTTQTRKVRRIDFLRTYLLSVSKFRKNTKKIFQTWKLELELIISFILKHNYLNILQEFQLLKRRLLIF